MGRWWGWGRRWVSAGSISFKLIANPSYATGSASLIFNIVSLKVNCIWDLNKESDVNGKTLVLKFEGCGFNSTPESGAQNPDWRTYCVLAVLPCGWDIKPKPISPLSCFSSIQWCYFEEQQRTWGGGPWIHGNILFLNQVRSGLYPATGLWQTFVTL